jgi:hypothetical protein
MSFISKYKLKKNTKHKNEDIFQMCGFGKYLIQKIVLQRPLKKVSLLKEMLRIIKQIVIPEKNRNRLLAFWINKKLRNRLTYQ